MSTILRSLKKLEEEKALLEKNLDLKHLMIQDDPGVGLAWWRARAIRWVLGAGLLAGGIVLGGLFKTWWQHSAPATARSGETAALQNPAPVPEPLSLPVRTASATAHIGIPLASIPEPVREPAALATVPRLSGAMALAPVESRAELPVAPPVELPPGVAPQAMVDEDSLAGENSLVDEELASLISQARTLAQAEDTVERYRAAAPSGNIPGFKLKGIIFFDDNSPSNYIFFSGPDGANQKLKVGESALGAHLKSIEAGKAVFDYRGSNVSIEIGD